MLEVPGRQPSTVYLAVDDYPPSVQVTLVYGKKDGPHLVLSEFKGCCGPAITKWMSWSSSMIWAPTMSAWMR